MVTLATLRGWPSNRLSNQSVWPGAPVLSFQFLHQFKIHMLMCSLHACIRLSLYTCNCGVSSAGCGGVESSLTPTKVLQQCILCCKKCSRTHQGANEEGNHTIFYCSKYCLLKALCHKLQSPISHMERPSSGIIYGMPLNILLPVTCSWLHFHA